MIFLYLNEFVRMSAYNDGIEREIEQGIEQGVENNIVNTVISMLKEKCSIELISRVTGKTKKEINYIKKN